MALTDNDDIILSFFEKAKEEVYVRIKLRDTLLAVYTTAVAATFAFAKATATFSNQSPGHTKEALLILPYIGFAFTLLVSYHHLSIATLGAYIKYELRAKLSAKTTVHVFDGWNRFASHRAGAQRLRTVGQAVILVTPQIVSLMINNEAAVSSQWPWVLFFWFGVLATLASIAVIARSYTDQKDLRGNEDERLHDRRSTDTHSSPGAS